MRAAVLISIFTIDVWACQVCIPYPRKSVADHLIEADAVVLAREDPKRPFHFRTTEVLKGAAPKSRLDLFLDNATRRVLDAYPDRAVVLARKGDVWQRHATVDPALLVIVRDVLRLAPAWKENARYDYFAKLLGHEHPRIRDLAHLEVARAPYAYIRTVKLPRKQILLALRDPRYAEWWALHILLLAQTGHAKDKRRIVDAMRSAPSLQLGAWATAFIEVEGEDAIAFLEARYLRRPRRTEEVEQVVAALSVFGGTDRLRDRIAAAYGVLLERRPQLAPTIVGDLLAWRRWELAGAIEKAAAKCEDPDDVAKLKWFVAMAARSSE